METRGIVLTGASGGLGIELAERLAEPGRALLLFGRDQARLEKAAQRARATGATVTTSTIPLEDAEGFSKAVEDFNNINSIDLFVANAGVKCGNISGIEPISQLRRIVEVNLIGTMTAAQSILTLMHEGNGGHLAFVSSLAAKSPQGPLLSYSATKSGVESYATALRRRCRGTPIKISIIRPGFIDTPMTDRQLGPTPMMISAPQAADRIVRGLERGRPIIAFPRVLGFLAGIATLLPARLSDLAANRFEAEILPDTDEARQKSARSEKSKSAL